MICILMGLSRENSGKQKDELYVLHLVFVKWILRLLFLFSQHVSQSEFMLMC